MARRIHKDYYSESLVADVFGGGACVNSEQEASQADGKLQQDSMEGNKSMGQSFAEGKEDFEQKIQMERRNELVQGRNRKEPDGMEQILWEEQRMQQEAAAQREMD